MTLFWFKTNFTKQISKFLNSFFDFKSKNELQKVLPFVNFVYEIEKWKTKNFQNSFCFLYTESAIQFSCENWNGKGHFCVFQFRFKIENWKMIKNFQSSISSWKLKIHFSFFNFPILLPNDASREIISAPKVPFNFQFKIEMEKDIFANMYNIFL